MPRRFFVEYNAMTTNTMKVAVIGAGIGGVAAATAFALKGATVTVFEQAHSLSEVGAGLQISANGMCVLRALGAVRNTPDGAVQSSGTELRDYRRFRRVSFVPPPKAGPTWYFHRADLLDLLVARAKDTGVTFQLGQSIADVDAQSGRVEDNGCFDLVIAADGGQSRLRAALNGNAAPRFSKQVAWRAVVPWSQENAPSYAVLTMGPGRHVVSYALRGGSLMNIVAVEERTDWTEEGWRLAGDPDDLRARFADFGGTTTALLAAVQDTHLWALYLHPVAQVWHKDRLALLGDAAHPTLPFMAQGACLALEDAWALAACVSERATVDAALARYQAVRQPRATRVVAAAAGNARNFHFAPPVNWLAQTAMAVIGARLSARYGWIYDYDVTRL
jgi:2-polyprenyl-6-methoxyphenol hydroxylase-like FAD-dependent oxidoreductase